MDTVQPAALVIFVKYVCKSKKRAALLIKSFPYKCNITIAFK